LPRSVAARSTRSTPQLIRLIRSSAASRYGVAVVCTATGIALRVALEPFLGLQLPYVTLFPAVMVSSWLGGFGPGILSTLLSSVAAAYLWLAPARALGLASPGGLVGLVLFWGVCFAISSLHEASRRAIRSVAEAEERLRATLVGIGDGVIATDEQGRVTRLNPVAETLTGWTESNALGRPLDEVFVILDEDTRRVAASPVARVLLEGRIASLANHTVLVARDGRETPIDDSAAPIRDDDGATVGAVLIFRDVGDRRRVERERAILLEKEQAARHEAAAAEEQLRLALEAGRMGTWQWTIDSGRVKWSPGLEAIHGLEPGTFPGTFEAVQHEVHPDDRERVAGAIRDAVAKGDPYRAEYRIVRTDGSIRWVEGIGQVFRERHGRATHMVGVCSDVTDRKQAEEALKDADRRKDEFLAVLSHELRNPINAVVGWAQILKSGTLSSDTVRHGLDVIERNARAEATLVESLLDLSRISAGKLDLQMRPMDLRSVAAAAVENARPIAKSKNVEVGLESTPEPVTIVADAGRLEQVLTNLLSNAVKFTPAGGQVRVQLERVDSRVIVRVIDNGKGIAPEFVPFVFDRFRQADSRRERHHGGLGLGLAVVRELVQAHGGTVTADSAGVGLGSTFTITLPTRIASEPETARAASPAGEALGAAIHGLRVLVVDDDQDARDLLAIALEGHGAAVRTAPSAAEGLRHLEQDRFDVLVADIGMPDEDGYSFVRRLRDREHHQQLAHLPAIAVTAYGGASDREQAFRAGFDLHLPKPVDPEVLVRAVSRFVPAAGA
jgi:PAS domain S-box-containing protein